MAVANQLWLRLLIGLDVSDQRPIVDGLLRTKKSLPLTSVYITRSFYGNKKHIPNQW